VLGPGFAVAGEEEVEQGSEGLPEVGGWQEGQEGPESSLGRLVHGTLHPKGTGRPFSSGPRAWGCAE